MNLEAWHRQQKALKDADRQKKKGASNNLRNYRSGTQQATWIKKQKELKDADRQSREVALNSLKNYKGGEHDVKEYERVLAKYRLQLIQQSRERALQHHKESHGDDNEQAGEEFDEEKWKEIVEQHIKEFDKMAAEHRQAQLDGLEGNWQSQFDSLEAAYHEGIEKGGDHRQDSSTVATTPDTSFFSEAGSGEETEDDDGEKQLSVEAEGEKQLEAQNDETILHGFEESNDESLQETQFDLLQAPVIVEQSQQSQEPKEGSFQEPLVDNLAALPVVEEKQRIELDFSFGLIYHMGSTPPTIESSSSAAAKIVPAILRKTLKQTLPDAVWDSTFAAVVTSVNIDPEFERDESIRYIVKGKVPVNVAVVGSQNGSRRSLHHRSPSEVIIGARDEQQWRRVRKGECPSWETILQGKMIGVGKV